MHSYSANNCKRDRWEKERGRKRKRESRVIKKISCISTVVANCPQFVAYNSAQGWQRGGRKKAKGRQQERDRGEGDLRECEDQPIYSAHPIY